MAFDFDALADIMVCPQSHARLVRDGDRLVSTDSQTRLAYAIRDEIPILLVDEAATLEPSEWQALMQKHGIDPGAPSQ